MNDIELIDYFAGLAMQTLYTQAWEDYRMGKVEEMASMSEIADDAYWMARGMLRAKKESENC